MSKLIVYYLPLRPDLTVRLLLPTDMTTADAERLSEIIKTLAFPPATAPKESTDGR